MIRSLRLLVGLLIASLWAGIVAAQPFPALYDVTGVAADDVLFIRDAPGTGGEIIDRFRPEETGIEVVFADQTGRWGRVRVGETMGWASLRFLERQPGQDWGTVPIQLNCTGAEPFWGMFIEDIGEPGLTASLSIMGGLDAAVSLGRLKHAPNDLRQMGAFGTIQATSGMGEETGLAGMAISIARQQCSDGMSDIDFGFSALLLIRSTSTQAMAGCCSLR